MELVEDHLRVRQHAPYRVQIGAMHVGAGRVHSGALPRIEARVQQPGQTLLRAGFRQADYFGVHEVRQHRVELLRLASVNLVCAQIARPASWAASVPLREKSFLRSPRFAPTDAVPYGRVRCRHRLAVEPNHLAKSAGDARLGVGKRDALGANATGPTVYAALTIRQRDVVFRPGQVVPRSRFHIADAPRRPQPEHSYPRTPRRSILMRSCGRGPSSD